MRPIRPRAIVVAAMLAGFAVFCVVQDRVTAAGARRYVVLQRGGGPPVSIDDVMNPAIDSSVRQGLAWGGAVALGGLAVAGVVARAGGR